MNIVELPSRQFGVEAAGIVTKIGADVKDLQVGDRVLCIRKHTFATHFVVPEITCAKIPDSLSFDEAGSMIFAFATAIYSLVNVGGMEKGQVSTTDFQTYEQPYQETACVALSSSNILTTYSLSSSTVLAEA